MRGLSLNTRIRTLRVISTTAAALLLVLAMAVRVDDSPHGEDFEISCSVCHSPAGWELDHEIYSFDHALTNLPLTGQHTSINCRLCHPSLVFSDAGTDCISCHTDMHAQTVGPDCARCHTPESWIVKNITEIHQLGRFQLIGPHLMADCMDCHPSASLLRFEPLRTECFDCHQEDYSSASNPNHVLGNISTNCIECHSMNAFTWAEAEFDHFFFPLTDGHAVYDCNSCHTGNDYSGLSPECYSCHKSDFEATSDPNHLTAGISTECMECHTTLPGWSPAEFALHDALFPLTDGHAINDCNSCHSGGYENTSPDCFICHQADYNATTNPGHVAANLPAECTQCHTTMPGWKPAAFPVHDAQFFPINSGKHLGEWNSCGDCHTNPGNWAVFSCLTCHEHSQQRMDDKHLGEVPGYVYTSAACLDCHPRGSTEGN